MRRRAMMIWTALVRQARLTIPLIDQDIASMFAVRTFMSSRDNARSRLRMSRETNALVGWLVAT